MTHERLRAIVNAAEMEFWAKVAELCPEITTGDFPPDATFNMEMNNMNDVRLWYKLNKKEEVCLK